MTLTALSLGSNLGNRSAAIGAMIDRLGGILLPPVSISSLMETEPVDVTGVQPWYYNQIISGYYKGDAQKLLRQCLTIENELGRQRGAPKSSRTADIDILLFGDEIIQSDDLVIPHASLTKRRFCLEGLCQIHPDWIVPDKKLTIKQLVEAMDLSVLSQQITMAVNGRNYGTK